MHDMVIGNEVRRRFANEVPLPLVLGGLGVVAMLSVSQCSEEEPRDYVDAPFTSVGACTAAGYPQGLCGAGHTNAYLEHEATVPRFDTLAACQEDWGSQSCMPLPAEPAPSGTGPMMAAAPALLFGPAMAGFVLSRSLQQDYAEDCRQDEDCEDDYRFGNYRRRVADGRPLYRDRIGRTVAMQLTRSGPRLTQVAVNSRTVARGGFGSRGGFRFGG